jgi:hypothetical protein
VKEGFVVPICMTDVKNISPLVELLEQITNQQYKIIAISNQDASNSQVTT